MVDGFALDEDLEVLARKIDDGVGRTGDADIDLNQSGGRSLENVGFLRGGGGLLLGRNGG